MDKEDKWDHANEEFMGFMNGFLQKAENDNLIHQSGQVLSCFGHFIASIEERKDADFTYFYKFVLKTYESDYSPSDKHAIVSKILLILEKVYPNFYSEYQKDISF